MERRGKYLGKNPNITVCISKKPTKVIKTQNKTNELSFLLHFRKYIFPSGWGELRIFSVRCRAPCGAASTPAKSVHLLFQQGLPETHQCHPVLCLFSSGLLWLWGKLNISYVNNFSLIETALPKFCAWKVGISVTAFHRDNFCYFSKFRLYEFSLLGEMKRSYPV